MATRLLIFFTPHDRIAFFKKNRLNLRKTFNLGLIVVITCIYIGELPCGIRGNHMVTLGVFGF